MSPLHKLLLLVLSTTTFYAAMTTTITPCSCSLSPEIVNELRDFLDLIPAATVDEIVAKHFIVDGNFRKALKYLRSAQFTQMLEQVQEIPEIIEILDYLHLRVQVMLEKEEEPKHLLPKSNIDTCWLPKLREEAEMETISEQELEIVLLGSISTEGPVAPPLPAALYTYDLHTFSTFVEELIEHLPRDKFVQMINAKRQKSAAFASFYTALRSAQLRPMVEVVLKTKNLAPVVRTLSDNDIDLTSLLPIGFKVISWGPVV